MVKVDKICRKLCDIGWDFSQIAYFSTDGEQVYLMHPYHATIVCNMFLEGCCIYKDDIQIYHGSKVRNNNG